MINTVFCFIIYNANNSFIERLELLVKKNCHIYLYLNKADECFFKNNFGKYKNIKFFGDNKNVGIGPALFEMEISALSEFYKYIIFFDQDTIFSTLTIDYINTLNLDLIFTEKYSVVQMLENTTPKSCGRDFKIFNSNLTINSGSIFNLDYIKKIRAHNPNFFVDCVDYEFCLFSSINGYKCGVISGVPDIDHTSDQGDKIYYIFGNKIKIRRYSFFRYLDYNRSILKLIGYSIIYFRVSFFLIFIKQFFIYNFIYFLSFIIV